MLQRKVLSFVALVVVASFLVQGSSAVWIALKEGERRCFFEEVPANTPISGTFTSEVLTQPDQLGSTRNELPPGAPLPQPDNVAIAAAQQVFLNKQFGIRVQIFFPETVAVFDVSYDRNGQFYFKSSDSGDYKICFSTNTTTWFSPMVFKFTFQLDTGSDATDYEKVAKKEHLNNLEVEVRRLLDRSQNIISELNYQKEREIAFRDTSESTNSRAAYFSLLQLGIIVVSAFIQMQYLKVFFRKRKLI